MRPLKPSLLNRTGTVLKCFGITRKVDSHIYHCYTLAISGSRCSQVLGFHFECAAKTALGHFPLWYIHPHGVYKVCIRRTSMPRRILIGSIYM